MELLGQLTDIARIWYALPLVVAVSLVYGATRHERIQDVLLQAGKSLFWTLVFFGVILGFIWFGGFWN